jgi:uncharacterized lipoprotein YajG
LLFGNGSISASQIDSCFTHSGRPVFARYRKQGEVCNIARRNSETEINTLHSRKENTFILRNNEFKKIIKAVPSNLHVQPSASGPVYKKAKFILEQAMQAQMGSRGITLLFL